MKEFTNRYILVYSAVLVVIVALILTVVSVSLSPLQERNRQLEQKQMILKTIGVASTPDDAERLYASHIEECEEGGVPYYRFEGGYVIPMEGNGLWGPIWGYIAIDEEGTVMGAVFDHKGETPGLGGEIASDRFAERFVGKSMRESPICLKKHADPSSPYEVDAISGGTMTSQGVTAMLEKTYNRYYTLFFGCRYEK